MKPRDLATRSRELKDRRRLDPDGFLRKAFTLPVDEERAKAREFLREFPSAGYMTIVERWRQLPDGNSRCDGYRRQIENELGMACTTHGHCDRPDLRGRSLHLPCSAASRAGDVKTICFSHPASTSPAERCLPDRTRGRYPQALCSACRAFPYRPSVLLWDRRRACPSGQDRTCLP
jgi:hypothetical protein